MLSRAASVAETKTQVTIKLPDGRLLGYADYGDPSGLPVLGFHGTPGSRLMFQIADAAARERGIRLLAPERPGFGLSTFQRRRTLATYTADIAAFADALGLPRFAVAGVSGGAPYAAACAALLPGRITALALVSPVGPMAGAERPKRLGAGHFLAFRVSPRLPPLLGGAFRIGRYGFLLAPLGMYGFLMSRAAPSDWRVLSRPEVRRNLLEGVREGLRPGVKASLQEMQLFAKPWGVSLDAIRAPSALWHGMADRNVPRSAALRLGELIAGCEVHRVEGAGHYWIFDNIGEVLGWIADAASRGPPTAKAGKVTPQHLN